LFYNENPENPDLIKSIRMRLPFLLDRLQPSETAVLLGTAILIGAGTGLAAVLFIRMIALVERILFGGGEALFGSLGRVLFILVPAAGGLLAGPIIYYFAQEAKGHGVPEVMKAIALEGGRIRPRVVVAKVLASALCIGSGGSAGREGPIVQVGSALGSSIGQLFHLSELRIRNLVACGAAAGIAATFNAPIAGVIFAMEVILGELNLGDMGNVVISAVTASTISRIFLGDRPAFTIPNYGMKSPLEILLYAVLGVLAAFVAVGFTRLLYWFEDLFDSWHFPEALKPGVGGLLLGILAFFYPIILVIGLVPKEELNLGFPLTANIPHVYGSGFSTIDPALMGELSFFLLLALLFLKPIATSLTLGSGNSGGVFAPLLFTGAALGGSFGWMIEYLIPGTTAGVGAFTTVGMAAVFAGAARAPFTAVLIVFEMTDDYRLIVPLMAGVIISLIVSEKMLKDSIYTLKLTRQGINFKKGRIVDVMESVHVHEVMVKQPVTIPANFPVSLLAGEFLRTGRHGFPVLNDDETLFGVVSLEDYRRATQNKNVSEDQLMVKEIATRDIVTVFPDESVGTALRRMAPRDISRLPVVKRDNPHRLIGVVRRNDIVRAYEVGTLRREQAIHLAEAQQNVDDTRAVFVDIPLQPESYAVGKTVMEINLPRPVVLVSIRRGHELVIPHGDTKLQSMDIVTALSEKEYAQVAEGLLKDGPEPEPKEAASK
jgi:CIC family chloride channel protein